MIRFPRKSNKENSDDNYPLFRDLQPNYPCIYSAGGHIPARLGKAYYSLRCSKLRFGQSLSTAEDIPSVGSLGGFGIPLLDQVDRETWHTLLSKPPSHRFTLAYTPTGSANPKYLLNKDLNMHLGRDRSDEVSEWVAKKCCIFLHYLLAHPTGHVNDIGCLIQSRETITGCFWLVAVQRKYRGLWIEDDKARD